MNDSNDQDAFDNEKYHCINTYWNIIELLSERRNIPCRFILREIAKTKQCDELNNLHDVRDTLTHQLGGKERVHKILSFGAILNRENKEYMHSALIHHKYFIHNRVRQGLPLHYSLYYWTIFRPEQILANMGIISHAGYLHKWTKN